MKLLSTLAALLVAGSVAAQDNAAASTGGAAPAPAATSAPAAEPAATATTTPPSSTLYDGTNWGMQFDVGAPAGATLALVYRPWQFLRVNAGAGFDVVAFGVKGGVTFIPFHWGVVPTIGFEAGHYFPGNLNNTITISDPVAKELAKEISFDYVAADLGLEFGSQNRFVFYVRVGLAQVWGTVKNMNAALANVNTVPNVSYKATDPSAEARIPAARIGFILYLF